MCVGNQYQELGRKLREMSETLALAALKNVSLAEDNRRLRGGARIGADDTVMLGDDCFCCSRRRTSVCVLAQWKWMHLGLNSG